MSGSSADLKHSGEWYDNIPDIGNTGIETWKVGMWLFLASEIMFFTGLIGSYIVLRLGADAWPEPDKVLAVPILGFNTGVLIVSSVTMVMALHFAKLLEHKKAAALLAATGLLGLLFLAIKLGDYHHMWNLQTAEYPNGFRTYTDLLGCVYYTLTGFHGLHVLIGVIAMFCLAYAALKEKYGPTNYAAIENVGLYWHFVDLIWIILFAILCLV